MNVDELQWYKFPVLDDGFVCLVDVMGDDAAIVQAARVSYGKDHRNDYERMRETLIKLYGEDGGESSYVSTCSTTLVRDFTPEQREKARQVIESDARNLIRYLMRHRHTTPLEMCELKFLVRVPMDTWRQWVRHRTANINEYSTRYTEAIDSQQKTAPDQWRLQSGSNKQGSSGFLAADANSHKDENEADEMDGTTLSRYEREYHTAARTVYQERLKAGVAREQARKDLPLSTYTEAYWKIDLHNLLHFLGLRMDSHAQKEIRDYATIIGEQIVKPLFPLVWEAFEDYRLGAMQLTRLDVEMMQHLNLHEDFNRACGESPFAENGWHKDKCRERDECKTKLERLGLL